MITKEDALQYHELEKPGKIELRPTKPCLSAREMRIAYLPGAVYPAKEIAEDPRKVFDYSSRGNLVGVVTNGSAVPGLGNVGPAAAKPMQEGMAVLFKRLSDIDVFNLELNTADPSVFINTVKTLEPTFGAINLKDISAPHGLKIYDELSEALNIPVFHENLYGTAVVAAAALINALALVEKDIKNIRVIICGAGTVGIGCARIFNLLGVSKDNLLLYDINGLIQREREDLSEYQRAFAQSLDQPATLQKAMDGADVFVGASSGNVVTQEMIRTMSSFPIVLALATPQPEIDYDQAKASRRDVLVATAQGQCPNAILDLLSFPYIFRGALDVQAKRITENMLIAAAKALADLAREDVVDEVARAYGYENFSFGPEYLLPKAIDPRILVSESSAVALQAIKDGVAQKKLSSEAYRESLTVRLGTGRQFMRGLIMKAKQNPQRVVFTEGHSEKIIRAASILVDEAIATPILLGNEEEIRQKSEVIGADLGGMQILDPIHCANFENYAEEYHRLRRRRGLLPREAREHMKQAEYFGGMMLHAGDADMLFTGGAAHYPSSLKIVLEIIGKDPKRKRVSSHHIVLLPKHVFVLADCAINIEPDAEELAEIALLAVQGARKLDIEPHVAMLSFSNYGSNDHPTTRKVRKATQLVKEQAPDINIDGELQLTTALRSDLRKRYFPFSELSQDANIFIFPDLQSGNLALNLLENMGDAVSIGPILTGTRLPVHLRQYGSSVEDVVNIVAAGTVEQIKTGQNVFNA